MKKSLLTLGLLGVIALWGQTSFATLQLELSHGSDQKLTVGRTPFVIKKITQPPQHKTAKKLGVAITGLIQHDLEKSGLFQVITFQNRPSLTQLKQANVDGWLEGTITPHLKHFMLSYQLKDPYQSSSLKHRIHKEHLFNVYWRRTAHRVSDRIYQTLTGKPGVFSTRMAYVLTQTPTLQSRRYQLIVSDVDGFNETVIETAKEPIMSPAWSPDGRKLAYVAFKGLYASIVTYDLVHKKRREVIRYPGNNGAPAWSPDGKKLAFVSTKNGYSKIYVLDCLKRRVRQLTHGGSIDTEPSWSLDSQSLLFTSNRSGNPQVYRLFFKGMRVRRVTYRGTYNAHASFFPDGKSIVLLHRKQSHYRIAEQSLDSMQMTLLNTPSSHLNRSPSIAPNGNMILYTTVHQHHQMLGMVSRDGNVQLYLPTREGDVQAPAWSPFLKRY